ETAVRIARAADGRRIIFTSGPSDAGAARRIAETARTRLGPRLQHRVVLCEEFDLAELRALIGRAALFIGGDSGPLHIAAATATPIVAVYGPTLAARSRPWRAPELVTEDVEPEPLACRPCDQRRCEPGDFRCLTSITPDRVADAAERALARANAGALPLVSGAAG
ncbi:MAG TPA: glycosyltransferase family 9 protein, partial [Vicinamibacterales bacterium]|nr:glycosyltransferase family 9 protein [Vicinamibacterales bacterium]